MVNPRRSERKRERTILLFNELMTSAVRTRVRTSGGALDLRESFRLLPRTEPGVGELGAGPVVAAEREKHALPPAQARR